MSYKVVNEEGEEIEVFSQEELDAIAAEKIAAEVQRVEEEKQAEKEELEAELAEQKEKLAKLEDKDRNFEQLRKSSGKVADQTAKELQEQIAQLNEKIETIASQPKNDVKEEFVIAKLGEDKEQRDRFEYYYKKLGADAKTKAEVLKAAEEALALTTGGNYQPDVSSGMHSVGASANYRNTPSKEVSEESKQIGAMFGVTDADRKKYPKNN